VPTERIDSLLAAGSRSAILGDHASARALLLEAASLDPRSSVIAYRLARTLDDQGDGEAAINQYCRYLSLAPAASDTAEVGSRLRTLGASANEPWLREVAAGVAAYDAGRFEEAAQAFTRVLTIRPETPAALYNRAVSKLAGGNSAGAIPDLEEYLRVLPLASERSLVEAQLAVLRRGATPTQVAVTQPAPQLPTSVRAGPAPASVLLRGLVLPGLGQMATGRSVLGVVVLAGAGGAIYLAGSEKSVTETKIALDPFGNPYEFEATVVEKPYRTTGFGLAAAIAVAAALEGYLYASRAPRLTGLSRDSQSHGRPSVVVSPARDALSFGFRIPSR